MALAAPLTRYWEGNSDVFYDRTFGVAGPNQMPIIYHDAYNISLWGLEKIHPFDAAKFRRIRDGLVAAGVLAGADAAVMPLEAPAAALRLLHTPRYLESLKSPATVAAVAEFPPLALLPSFLVDRKFLMPNRIHVGGSILAGKLALEHGWAINVGGGMHHAHSDGGGGWCVYADVVLSYLHLRLAYPERVRRIMIVDLDVHQGNGHERDRLRLAAAAEDVATAAAAAAGVGGASAAAATGQSDAARAAADAVADAAAADAGSLQELHSPEATGASSGAEGSGGGGGGDPVESGGGLDGFGGPGSIFTLDVFRPDIYPGDAFAARAVDLPVYVRAADDDDAYLTKVGAALDKAFALFSPDVVYFFAGTDILMGDPLGRMNITPAGIVARDEAVWRACRERGVPVVYVTAGGYTKPLSAQTVTRSLVNLHEKFGLKRSG